MLPNTSSNKRLRNTTFMSWNSLAKVAHHFSKKVVKFVNHDELTLNLPDVESGSSPSPHSKKSAAYKVCTYTHLSDPARIRMKPDYPDPDTVASSQTLASRSWQQASNNTLQRRAPDTPTTVQFPTRPRFKSEERERERREESLIINHQMQCTVTLSSQQQ